MEVIKDEVARFIGKTIFLERAPLGGASQALERIIGSSLEELEQLTQLRIPESIHQPAIDLVEDSIQDGRERLVTFVSQGKHLVPGKIEKSAPLDARNLSKKIGFKTGLLEFFWRHYLAKPTPLILHTHPTLMTEILVDNGYPGCDFGTGEKFDPEQTVKFFNMFAQFFSQDDLQNLEINSRYLKSFMLATSEGTIWLIEKRKKLPFFQSPVARAAREYGRKMREVATRWGWAVAEGTGGPMFEDEVREDCNVIIKEFCEKDGMVAFANRDYKNSTLHRIGE